MGIPTIKSYPMPTAPDLPENKVSWQVEPDRAVLLIHDMQQYFIDFYHADQSPITELVQHIVSLKRQCKALGIPVVYTAQPGDQDPSDRALLTDFWGDGLADDQNVTKIVDELTPEDNDLVLTKWRYSAFKKSNLLETLQEQGRDQLIICGVYAHIGCLITANEAFMDDVQSFFVADAVADFSLDEHKMAMNYVAKRCGVTISTASLMDDLQNAKDMSAGGVAHALTFEGVREQAAELLDIPASELSDTDDLMMMGLDSIRLMSLVEEWRQVGVDVNFMEIVKKRTLSDWWSLISESKQEV